MNKFWYVFNPEGRQPTYQHGTLMSAQTEATRLARLNPGQRFIVLEAIEFHQKVDVQVTRLSEGYSLDEENPF